MHNNEVSVGIDIGSHLVRVVVARNDPVKPGKPLVIGTGQAESKGVRHGYILNMEDVASAVKAAIGQASEAAKIKISTAFLAVGGIGLDELHARGEAVIARADAEVTDLDIERAIESSREHAASRFVNRRILHTVPLRYLIDGVEVLGRPHGMKGTKLGVDVLYITCLDQHVNDLVDAVESAGVSVLDTLAAPLAASIVTLTNADKRAGAVLANIGSETLSMLVFDNGVPISLKVFKMGALDITKDLALGLRLSMEDAEHLKTGSQNISTSVKKRYDDILSTRLTAMFSLVENHLKKIGKDQLLPAGIVITGGGSGTGHIKEIAERSLKLHSKIAQLNIPGDTYISDSSWTVAYGLTVWGLSGASNASLGSSFFATIVKFLQAQLAKLAP